MPLQIVTVTSDPFAQNAYIVWRDGQSEAIIIDPGFEWQAMRDQLAERELGLAALVCTHGHVDHIAGNSRLKKLFPHAPLVIGTGDAAMLTDPMLNLSEGFGIPVVSPPADRLVNEGETVNYAGIEMDVFDLPGHSPGHVVFVVRGESPPIVFGGDVVFRGGVGRTDFPGGDFETLRNGVRKHLWPLPPATVIYPGHGPVTTVGHERRTNPYLADTPV